MQGLFYCLQKGLFIETLKRCQNLYKQQIIFKPTETYFSSFFFFFNFVRSLRFCIFNIRQQWFYLHPRFLCKYSPKCITNFGLYRRNSYSTLFAQETRGGEEHGVGRNAGLGLKVLTSLFLIHLGESYEIDTFLRSVEDSDLLTAQYKIHILKIASFFFHQFTNLTTNLFFLISFSLIYFFLYFFRYIICMSTEKKITTCM